MSDQKKPEELSAEDLDQAVGGVASTAGTNPEGFKAGADLASTVKKKKKATIEPESKNFGSTASGSPNV